MIFKNKTYDILKYIAQYVLPAAGTLYFALSTIWGLPNGEQIVGTITAVDAFLGVLLGISTNNYKKLDNTDGALVVDTTDPSKDVYRMELNTPVEDLSGKKQVTFKVNADGGKTSTKSSTKAKK